MKNLIIGGLIGGFIFFIWSFLSWAALDLHYKDMQYTDKQEEVLKSFSEIGLQPGSYMMPRTPQGTDQETSEAVMKANEGKPWAMIQYHPSMEYNMGMNMFRGLFVNILAALFLTWILMQFADLTLPKAILTSIAAGLIGYFTVTYVNSIWFEGNSLMALIDALVSHTLVGAALGFFLTRGKNKG